MKQLLDLDAFVKIMTDKGYSGYFMTNGDYPDKIKDSISRFLTALRQGRDDWSGTPNILFLRTYLQWDGDDKESIECYMWVKYENGTFDVQEMGIERRDGEGNQLMKRSKLENISTDLVPSVEEAIAQVAEAPKQKFSSKPSKSKRFRL